MESKPDKKTARIQPAPPAPFRYRELLLIPCSFFTIWLMCWIFGALYIWVSDWVKPILWEMGFDQAYWSIPLSDHNYKPGMVSHQAGTEAKSAPHRGTQNATSARSKSVEGVHGRTSLSLEKLYYDQGPEHPCCSCREPWAAIWFVP